MYVISTKTYTASIGFTMFSYIVCFTVFVVGTCTYNNIMCGYSRDRFFKVLNNNN